MQERTTKSIWSKFPILTDEETKAKRDNLIATQQACWPVREDLPLTQRSSPYWDETVGDDEIESSEQACVHILAITLRKCNGKNISLIVVEKW